MDKISWTNGVKNVVLEKDGEDQSDGWSEKCGAGEGWRRSVGPME